MIIRQTVFYTPSTMTVNNGDHIVGTLSCAPNARNNRDLDIGFRYKVEGETEEKHIQYKMCVIYFSHFEGGVIPTRVYANQLSGLDFIIPSVA